jgi:hypothetical protein
MQREREPETAVTIAADLERHRLQQRVARMDAVVRELRLRARFHQERHGHAPPPLRHAIAGFVLEARSLDRRLAELARGTDSSRRPRTGRFDRRSASRT